MILNALTFKFTVPDGLDVTFVPDNSGVVSVDENGVGTALKTPWRTCRSTAKDRSMMK